MKLVTPAMVESNTVDAPQQNNLDLLPAVIPPEAVEGFPLEPTDKFDWSDPEAVVLREQPETACYFKIRRTDLVIRQRPVTRTTTASSLSRRTISTRSWTRSRTFAACHPSGARQNEHQKRKEYAAALLCNFHQRPGSDRQPLSRSA